MSAILAKAALAASVTLLAVLGAGESRADALPGAWEGRRAVAEELRARACAGDADAAARLAEVAAHDQNAAAIHALAKIAADPACGAPDARSAEQLLRAAAALGYAPAKHDLGRRLVTAPDGDRARGVALLREAFAGGYETANLTLAELLVRGEHLPRDLEGAGGLIRELQEAVDPAVQGAAFEVRLARLFADLAVAADQEGHPAAETLLNRALPVACGATLRDPAADASLAPVRDALLRRAGYPHGTWSRIRARPSAFAYAEIEDAYDLASCAANAPACPECFCVAEPGPDGPLSACR